MPSLFDDSDTCNFTDFLNLKNDGSLLILGDDRKTKINIFQFNALGELVNVN